MNARQRRTNYPTLTAEQFRERIRAILKLPPIETNKPDRAIVRTPQDAGYYPTGKPILDALINASESLADPPKGNDK